MTPMNTQTPNNTNAAAEPQTPLPRPVVMALLDEAMAQVAGSRVNQGREREHAVVVAVDVHISFMRPVTAQSEATAKVVGGGKTMVFCEAQLCDHQGHVVAQALGTYRAQRYTHRADE